MSDECRQVEISGPLFLAFGAACVNLSLYLQPEDEAFLATVRPDGWYPLERFQRLMAVVSGVYHDPMPILRRLGAFMMSAWYHNGPGRELVSSGVDFLRFQTSSHGYRSVIRGPKPALGDFRLVALDEEMGTATVVSTTPFPRNMEFGILAGGMRLVGDLPYVRVDLDEGENRFRIQFTPSTVIDELPSLPKLETGDLAPRQVRHLVWQNRALEAELDDEKTFWLSTNETLVATHREVLARDEEIRALNQRITEHVLHRYLAPDIADQLVADGEEFSRPRSQDITVMFVDLVGFTALADEASPELTAEVINDFLSTMTDVILDHLGTIDKFIGDGIMVLFGTPHPMHAKEQARRAADCGRAMHEAMKTINARLADNGLAAMQIRVGIHSGPALVGSFGSDRRSDFTCHGSTVNLASRVEALCLPGETWLTQTTAGLLDEESTVSVGQHSVRGFANEVELMQLR